MEKYKVFWRKEHIGEFELEIMDMGFMEGGFTSIDSEMAKTFIEKVSHFDPKKVIRDHKLGLRVVLKKEDYAVNVLVFGLNSSSELFLKWVIGSQERIDSFLKYVPE